MTEFEQFTNPTNPNYNNFIKYFRQFTLVDSEYEGGWSADFTHCKDESVEAKVVENFNTHFKLSICRETFDNLLSFFRNLNAKIDEKVEIKSSDSFEFISKHHLNKFFECRSVVDGIASWKTKSSWILDGTKFIHVDVEKELFRFDFGKWIPFDKISQDAKFCSVVMKATQYKKKTYDEMEM